MNPELILEHRVKINEGFHLSGKFEMMSLLLLMLISSLITESYSAIYLERQRVLPGHENLCYDKEDNIFYEKGEEMKWKMKACGRKLCKGSNGREYVYAEIQTCGRIYVPPGCKTEINLQLPYPNCCERVVCPEISISDKNLT